MFIRAHRLRQALPAFVNRAFANLFWEFFWYGEEREERCALGIKKSPRIRGSERAELTEKIAEHYPFDSLLEMGSGYGQNFHILGKLFPEVKLVGLDLDAERVRQGNAHLAKSGLRQATLIQQDARELSKYETSSFDVVISCGFFLYLTPCEAAQVLSEMLRVSRRAVILLEQHQDLGEGEEPQIIREGGREDYWVHDFNSLIPGSEALEFLVSPVPNPRWVHEQWGDCASVIEVGRVAKS